ncbi:cell division protein FtsH [Candidatus Uhrbacteria bacterium CG_4_10_14_0_8_um_filter_58_22]|uniref:ATP-dependent zinc metalloprotease FtsH n=1 Tax=Candidatus Uhrbacteria bacterium CG_4_10_14_0_8_um_filter_58_22 TaxID=1975029 RepID=A0A2M7QAG8_9BACT|nr:MAG: cell division protein FtsH [Parcubacteria group bacterium CG1_02_58_44]PIY63023.1 MAG: cell division protein FtsH [Candidatus Uhrbacteria bacterium CG_4_10_14_0_8_um_filter_58_22]
MKNVTKYLTKNLIISVVVFLVIAAILSTYSLKNDQPNEIQVSQLVSQIEADEVKSVTVRGDELQIELKDGTKEKTQKEPGESFTTLLANYQVTPEKMTGIEFDIKKEGGVAYWVGTLLPFLLPFLLIAVFIWIMMRQVQGANSRAMSFGSSSAREIPKNSKDRITFKDVAGVKEAKEELMEVVEFLKSSKKFIALGAKIPKGVLLMGSPGTGKTLLARAVAGEANVPFYHISGSEFVEMFVGVGASRVRDLFAKAKKNTPCIVFIDEIDAVGRQRGSGLGGSHDEREQTLNQILVEMDGFDPNQGVIVLAATNRPDVLDPALLRPGRFDRRVVLDEPDINDREAILNIHAKNKPLIEGIDLRRIAERTPGFSGADLANLMNEAAILTARRNKTKISMSELTESIEKVMLGPERKSYLLSERERRVTAYHEAGHALVAHRLPDADPIHKISIISRGSAAGYTLKLPIEDRRMHRRAEFLADLAMSLGGYVAEQEIFGRDNLTTGASSDLRQATRLARRLVTDFGMSDKLGPRTYGEKEEMVFLGKEIRHERDYSEKTAELIDSEINQLIADAKETATRIIGERRQDMEKIVELLLKQETIEKEEFEELLGKKEAA